MLEKLAQEVLEQAQAIPARVALLATAGFFGALVDAYRKPQPNLWRRFGRLGVGLATAVFLGPAFADILSVMVEFEDATSALMAAGFLLGVAGIVAVDSLEARFFGVKGGEK